MQYSFIAVVLIRLSPAYNHPEHFSALSLTIHCSHAEIVELWQHHFACFMLSQRSFKFYLFSTLENLPGKKPFPIIETLFDCRAKYFSIMTEIHGQVIDSKSSSLYMCFSKIFCSLINCFCVFYWSWQPGCTEFYIQFEQTAPEIYVKYNLSHMLLWWDKCLRFDVRQKIFELSTSSFVEKQEEGVVCENSWRDRPEQGSQKGFFGFFSTSFQWDSWKFPLIW